MVQLLWKTVWIFLKKLNIELPQDPGISLLGIHTKELKAGTAQISVDGWMVKQNVIYPHNAMWFSLKREEILTPATTWMSFEDIMVSKTSQSQETNTHYSSRSQSHGHTKQTLLLLFNGSRVSVLQDEYVLEMTGGDGGTAKWRYLMPLNWILRNGYNVNFYVMYVFPL